VSDRYEFNSRDRALLQAAATLLKKVAEAATTRPAQLVSVAKLQHVLSALPKPTSGLKVSVSVASPRGKFGDIETMHWWEVGVEEDRLSITSGGHYYDPSTGGDTFTTMTWEAIPEEPAEFSDYRGSLWMVPDVRSFPEGVASIDFNSGVYSVEITDDDNPLLEEGDDSEEEEIEDDEEEAGDDADVDEADEEESEHWSIHPVDAVEKKLAAIVNSDQVDANEPVYAYGAQNCDFCGCALDGRGLYVDGRLHGRLMWGNMCAACFGRCGQGIGWGIGQLFARQPDGKWRMVAGW